MCNYGCSVHGTTATLHYLGGKGCCDYSCLGKEIRVHEKSNDAEFFIHQIKTITNESDLKSQDLVSGMTFGTSASKLSPE